MRENLRAVARVLRLGLRGEWPRAVACGLCTLVTMAAQPLTALVLKGLTDAAADGRMGQARQAAVVLAFVLGAWALVGWASFALRMGLRERSGGVIEAELALMTGSIHGLEHHERPDYLDEMSLLHQQQVQLTGVIDAVALNTALLVQLGKPTSAARSGSSVSAPPWNGCSTRPKGRWRRALGAWPSAPPPRRRSDG